MTYITSQFVELPPSSFPLKAKFAGKFSGKTWFVGEFV